MYSNSPCSVMTKLQETALACSMILHLPNASTCYDKLIIYYTQQLQQLTYYNLPYHTWRRASYFATWYLTATQIIWALSGILWLGLSAVIRMLQLQHYPLFWLSPSLDHFWSGCVNLGFSLKLFFVQSSGRPTYKWYIMPKFHCRPFPQFFLELSRFHYGSTAWFRHK